MRSCPSDHRWSVLLDQLGCESLGTSGNLRAGRAGRIGGFKFVGHGVANRVKPFTTPTVVDPAFGKVTFGVVAVEQVFGPFSIGQGVRIFGVGDVRFSAIAKFGFVAWPAVRA